MRARAIAIGLAAGAVVVSLLLPAGAVAGPAPRTRSTPPAIDQEIIEQGSNGYLIKVGVHDRHRLTLSAQKLGRGLSFETASYVMPVRLPSGSTRIRARLGRLGRIDMRFLPEKVKELAPPNSCKGGKIVEEEGFWVGLLAFHGEHGFTEVRVRSALGAVVKRPPLRCREPKPINLKKLERELEKLKEKQEKEGEEEGTEAEADEGSQAIRLEASARRHRVTFLASRLALGKGRKRSSFSNLVVAATRRRGRIEESAGVAEVLAPGSYLRPGDSRDPLAELVVRPHAPFSGSATYRTHRHAPPTWGGDLKVDIPIFGEVRLAGEGVRAAACESAISSCRGIIHRRSLSVLRPRLLAWTDPR